MKSVIYPQVHDVERVAQWGHKLLVTKSSPIEHSQTLFHSLLDNFINHKLSSFVLLVPPIVLDLIARTISVLAYKSRMITEKVRQQLLGIATRESSTNVSQKSGKICKYL